MHKLDSSAALLATRNLFKLPHGMECWRHEMTLSTNCIVVIVFIVSINVVVILLIANMGFIVDIVSDATVSIGMIMITIVVSTSYCT